MKDYEASTYGDTYAAVYDLWYGEEDSARAKNLSDPEHVARKVVELALGGAVLELGIGSGRLAIAMDRIGLKVTGVDSSALMLDLLRSKSDARNITVIHDDMSKCTDLEADSYSVVLIGFNTFFNLTTKESQEACIRTCARVLKPGGKLVIEAFVPVPQATDHVSVRSMEVDQLLLDAVKVDPISQTISGQLVKMSKTGNEFYPYLLRYCTPPEIDEMTRATGFELLARHQDWLNNTFDSESSKHVSVWQLR
jgi:ubiquinone/menaquinone biosynthesis C-methylase UbiE|tara:strand:- start:43876 stop:44631 length:756 start_codon:yes stop_codon:yes gene_type:complete